MKPPDLSPARAGTAAPRSPAPTQRGSSPRAGHRRTAAERGRGLCSAAGEAGAPRGQGQRPWRLRPGRGRRGVNCSRVPEPRPRPRAPGSRGPRASHSTRGGARLCGARLSQPPGPTAPVPPVLSLSPRARVPPGRVPLPPLGPAPHRSGPAPPPRRPIARQDYALLSITPPPAGAWPRPRTDSQWQRSVCHGGDRK